MTLSLMGPLGKIRPGDLHREIKIPAFPTGRDTAHTPKPEAGSIANIRGNRNHNRLSSMRNADKLAGSQEGLPWCNGNGPVDITGFPLKGTDILKPWRTSPL